jgi:hypothetical protein
MAVDRLRQLVVHGDVEPGGERMAGVEEELDPLAATAELIRWSHSSKERPRVSPAPVVSWSSSGQRAASSRAWLTISMLARVPPPRTFGRSSPTEGAGGASSR